ncbi:hypothetical protein HK101_001451 [Irineochytrium annulatum]|nr:hypothetical protein HK101_001451 [Irineochytrium annulatum]
MSESSDFEKDAASPPHSWSSMSGGASSPSDSGSACASPVQVPDHVMGDLPPPPPPPVPRAAPSAKSSPAKSPNSHTHSNVFSKSEVFPHVKECLDKLWHAKQGAVIKDEGHYKKVAKDINDSVFQRVKERKVLKGNKEELRKLVQEEVRRHTSGP